MKFKVIMMLVLPVVFFSGCQTANKKFTTENSKACTDWIIYWGGTVELPAWTVAKPEALNITQKRELTSFKSIQLFLLKHANISAILIDSVNSPAQRDKLNFCKLKLDTGKQISELLYNFLEDYDEVNLQEKKVGLRLKTPFGTSCNDEQKIEYVRWPIVLSVETENISRDVLISLTNRLIEWKNYYQNITSTDFDIYKSPPVLGLNCSDNDIVNYWRRHIFHFNFIDLEIQDVQIHHDIGCITVRTHADRDLKQWCDSLFGQRN